MSQFQSRHPSWAGQGGPGPKGPNSPPYGATLGRYRDTAFGPAFLVAVGLMVLVFLYLPVEWLEEHWLRSRPFGSEAEGEAVQLPREIRIVEILPESDAPPAPASALEPVVHILSEPAEPVLEPEVATPESGVDGATSDWTYDPSTPYAAGREILLRHREPPAPPDLKTHLNILQMRHSARWLLEPAPYDTFAVASVRHTFRQQDQATKQRLAPGWMEEMRQRRVQDYWERYIMSDGDN